MKEMTCPQMGGPATCTAVLSGNSVDEILANGTTHLHEAHPELEKDMEAMPKEQMDAWRADFQKKWDATADK